MHTILLQSHTFTEEALQTLTSLKDDFMKDINDAIQNGNVPSKSMKNDLLQRVATSLHVLNFITDALLQGRKPLAPPMQIIITPNTPAGQTLRRVRSNSERNCYGDKNKYLYFIVFKTIFH